MLREHVRTKGHHVEDPVQQHVDACDGADHVVRLESLLVGNPGVCMLLGLLGIFVGAAASAS